MPRSGNGSGRLRVLADPRGLRAYKEESLPSHDLDRILEAAWRTPSSMNGQPWDFVLCTERETLRQLAETWRYARHVAGSAATVALVAPTPVDQDFRDWLFKDMGQATMSMMLAAADLGIGSSHAALAGSTPRSSDRDDDLALSLSRL